MNQMLLNTDTFTKVSDVIEILLRKGQGKVYVEDITDKPYLPVPTKPATSYTHHFVAKYTRNALSISADCYVLVLTDGRTLVSTTTKPAYTIKHSSTNVAKTTGTAYQVPSNVKEIYRITTIYQITKPRDVVPTGIFADNAQWAMHITNYRHFVMGFMTGLDYVVTNQGRSIERIL